MIPPRFAIIGSGGSGTAYMAAVLRANRVDCGHEQWWTPLPGNRRSGLDGDASWLAVPDIEAGVWSGPVLHVTRHPLGVVRNLVSGGIFSPQPTYDQFREFALRHEPQLADLEPAPAAVAWWLRWNRRCAAVADQTVRIEDTEALLDAMGNLAGRALDRHRARRVSPALNHRARRGAVDEAKVWRLLAGRADEFGYRERVCESAAR